MNDTAPDFLDTAVILDRGVPAFDMEIETKDGRTQRFVMEDVFRGVTNDGLDCLRFANGSGSFDIDCRDIKRCVITPKEKP